MGGQNYKGEAIEGLLPLIAPLLVPTPTNMRGFIETRIRSFAKEGNVARLFEGGPSVSLLREAGLEGYINELEEHKDVVVCTNHF